MPACPAVLLELTTMGMWLRRAFTGYHLCGCAAIDLSPNPYSALDVFLGLSALGPN